jgi:hypothetical protein
MDSSIGGDAEDDALGLDRVGVVESKSVANFFARQTLRTLGSIILGTQSAAASWCRVVGQ